MPIYVDGRSIRKSKATLFDAVLTQIQSLQSQNRYVESLSIDGQSVQVNHLDDFRTKFRGDEIVSIDSCTLDELIESVMASAGEYIPSLYRTLEGATVGLRTGDIAKGADLFSQTTAGIDWMLTAISRLTTLHPGPSLVHELGTTGQTIIAPLADAWNSRDYVLVADIIQYELQPWLTRCFELTQVFSQQMQLEKLKQGMNHDDR